MDNQIKQSAESKVWDAVLDMFLRIAEGEIRYPEEIIIFPQLAKLLIENAGEGC